MQTPTTVELGALADPLTEQLKGFCDSESLALLEEDRLALVRCLIRGYVPESAIERGRVRLAKKIGEACQKFARTYQCRK
jgi:hypothetical protein